jgi:hypothetical protein
LFSMGEGAYLIICEIYFSGGSTFRHDWLEE